MTLTDEQLADILAGCRLSEHLRGPLGPGSTLPAPALDPATLEAAADDDPAWIMTGDLAPTDNEIRWAGIRWCGDQKRETFMSDEYYFRNNWWALDGLKAYVAREIASRTKLALERAAAIRALADQAPAGKGDSHD